jgi:hypothetical protein
MSAQWDDGATAGLQTNDIVHQVWDSNLVPHGYIITTRIYWLNDSTLLFAADKGSKSATVVTSSRIPWLYFWHLGDKPHPIGDDPQEATHFYRAARGIICFQQRKIDPETGIASKVLMKGPPGEEREILPWRGLTVEKDGVPSNGYGFVEDVDCEQFADPAMAGRIYETDARRRYYVDRAPYPPGLPPFVGENPVLMKSDGTDREVLPNSPDEFGGVYSRTFENVFWSLENPLGSALRGGPIVDGFAKWQGNNCLALWRIDPASGDTGRRCVPFGPWAGHHVEGSKHNVALVGLIPTVRGLFLTSYDYTDGSDEHVGASGLYMMEPNTLRRVLAGYILQANVSPSGCRIAFSYGPNRATRRFGTPGSWTIAVIDVCSATVQPGKN